MRAALVALLILPAAASAQIPTSFYSCTVKEFAQYQQKVKTSAGLLITALEACEYQRNAAAIPTSYRMHQVCKSEQSKAADAISGTGKYAWQQYVLSGCSGSPPN